MAAFLCLMLLGAALVLGASFFLGKSSKSYAATKAMVDEAQKKYGSKVTFTVYDYDSPKSAAAKQSDSVAAALGSRSTACSRWSRRPSSAARTVSSTTLRNVRSSAAH